MIKRLVAGVLALFAIGAAAGVAVVAAAFALYALLLGPLTPAGASAAVALAFAVIAAVLALILRAAARGGGRRRGEDHRPMDRIGQMARHHPVLAAVGALAAGVVALKNPQAVASIISAVMATRAAEKVDRRR